MLRAGGRCCRLGGAAPQSRVNSARRASVALGNAARLVPVRGAASATQSAAPASSLGVAGRALLLVPCGITFGLGVWQIGRLQWKKDQIIIREQKLHSEPLAIADLTEDSLHDGTMAHKLADIEFRQVRLDGVFCHEEEAYVGMRARPGEESSGSGYHVVTPFVLRGGSRVLVNRGWLPRKDVEARRAPGRVLPPATEESLVGVVRLGEKKQYYMTAGGGEKREWTYFGVEEIGAASGVAPSHAHVVFDAVAGEALDKGSLVDRSDMTGRELASFMVFAVTTYKHTVYAGTWFLLCGCMVAMSAARLRHVPAAAKAAARTAKPRRKRIARQGQGS